MDTNSIDVIELGLVSIVCIAYIVGKVWVYHNHTKDTNDTKSKGVIKRGPEWPE